MATTGSHCAACGQEVPAEADFCPKCGQRQKGPGTQPGVRSVAPVAEVAASAPAGAKPATGSGGESALYTEKDLWSGRYSPKAMFGTAITVGLITLGILVLAVVIGRSNVWLVSLLAIVVVWGAAGYTFAVRRFGIRYRLTTQRLVLERGLLFKRTDRIDVIDIDDISVEQGPIDRALGLGTILVLANDRTDARLKMPGIENATQIADMLDDARRAVQRRRGLRIDVNAPDGHGH